MPLMHSEAMVYVRVHDEKVRRWLAEHRRQAPEVSRRVLQALGLLCETRTKEYTPVVTGHLRDHIHWHQPDEDRVTVGSNVVYAPKIIGSPPAEGRHRGPREILRTAARETLSEVDTIAQRVVQQMMR